MPRFFLFGCPDPETSITIRDISGADIAYGRVTFSLSSWTNEEEEKFGIANPFPPPSPANLVLQKAKKPLQFVNPDGGGCNDDDRDLPLMVSDLDNGHLGFVLRCLLKLLVGVVTTYSPTVTNNN
ncbi:hypothetical protein LWI28_016903 [Acer negundo]|uniref:Uncharacterized protein n=1 Tax=Acer negundo TaxID=4023 RepID=A0AAD5JM23_ACENE|nr:hypothetical protein LWI28_016903 [Acer negundo]